MKSYIINQVNKLTLEQRIELLQYLMEVNVKLHQHADGCRINLDNVPQEHIKIIYNMMKKFLDVPHVHKID